MKEKEIKNNNKNTVNCSCGKTIILEDQYMGACKCPKCGKWYNMFGDRIKTPDEWV